MEAFTTPGAVSWTELVTSDPAAAAEFYGGLFGWQFDTMEMGGGPYHVVKVGNDAIGGVMAMPPGAPSMPPKWTPYVTVRDVEATIARCTALGGQVCVPPMDIPGVGRFAVIADPQGATINVIAYAPPTGGA